MLSVVVVLCAIGGYSLIAMRYLRMELHQAPIFALSGMILLVYLGGLLGILGFVGWAVILAGVAALPACIVLDWQRQPAKVAGEIPRGNLDGANVWRGRLIASCQKYGLLFLAVALLVFLGMKWDPTYRVLNWDEYSHWAFATRMMALEDTLPQIDTPLAFTTYPPAAAIAQYLFLKISGYQEWLALFGHVTLVFASLFAATGPAHRSPVSGILMFAFSVTAVFALRYTILDVYVDSLLAVVMAAAIVPVVFSSRGWTSTIYLSVVLSMLVLIKPMGLVLSLVPLGCYTAALAVDLWRSCKRQEGKLILLAGRFAGQVMCVLAAVLVTTLSWQIWKQHINATDPFSGATYTLSDIIAFFIHPQDDPRSAQIWSMLPTKLNSVLDFLYLEYSLPGVFSFVLKFSPADVILILALFSVLAILATPAGSRLRTGAVIGVVGAGTAPYLLLLVVAYRFVFDAYEGPRYASFERYFGTYILMWLIVIASVIAFAAVNRGIVGRSVWWFLAAVFLLGAPTPLVRALVMPENRRAVPAVGQWANTYNENMALRRQTEMLSATVRSVAKPDDRIYYISQNETGYTFYMFKFVVAPLRCNTSAFSLGRPYYEGDIWTVDVKLEDALKDYAYLVIRRSDDQFEKEYGHNFNPADLDHLSRSVFRVSYIEGRLKLDRVPTIKPAT